MGVLALTTWVMMDDSWVWFFGCGLIGLATGIAFVFITQYYTSGSWRPVKEIAEASRTGPATNIITGTAVGLETTAMTAIAVGTALVASFLLGSHSPVADLPQVGEFSAGVIERRDQRVAGGDARCDDIPRGPLPLGIFVGAEPGDQSVDGVRRFGCGCMDRCRADEKDRGNQQKQNSASEKQHVVPVLGESFSHKLHCNRHGAISSSDAARPG